MFTRIVFEGNVPNQGTFIRVKKSLFGKPYLFIYGEKVKTEDIITILDEYDRFLEEGISYANAVHDISGWSGFFREDRIEIGCKKFAKGDIDFLLNLLKVKRKKYV